MYNFLYKRSTFYLLYGFMVKIIQNNKTSTNYIHLYIFLFKSINRLYFTNTFVNLIDVLKKKYAAVHIRY